MDKVIDAMFEVGLFTLAVALVSIQIARWVFG